MSIFNDTQLAFKNKTTGQLKKAYWMFKCIEHPSLTNIGISLMNFSVKNNFPFVDDVMKKTLFEQFVGGETQEKSMEVVKQLFKSKVRSIFDYAVEGKETEEAFEHTFNEIKQNIRFAQGNPAIPFVVFKPTGFGRLGLYECIQNGGSLTSSEKNEWERVKKRYQEVCQLAHDTDVTLMIDAEETWIQNAVDELVNQMMEQYNKEKPIVWNTIQMYRTQRIEYLEKDLKRAHEKGYYLGYKFVRGAYMEKERERAAVMGYADPIMPHKNATDDNYNAAIDWVMQHLDKVSAFFGTHNEKSTELVMDKLCEKSLAKDFNKIYFGQLYGMSDNISMYLGEHGYNVSKYLPYGMVKDVIPYLSRRAQENTSVAGQTGRELGLIQTELNRRNGR